MSRLAAHATMDDGAAMLGGSRVDVLLFVMGDEMHARAYTERMQWRENESTSQCGTAKMWMWRCGVLVTDMARPCGHGCVERVAV